MLHGCTVGDNSLVGMGATVLNGVRIGRNCVIGANALITENKVIPDNSLVKRAPAKVVGEIDESGVLALRSRLASISRAGVAIGWGLPA